MSEGSAVYQAITNVGPSAEATAVIPWWLHGVVILGALLTATGSILALVYPVTLVSPHDEINGAVHIYASYFASRNIALAIMLVLLLGLREAGA